MNQSELAGLLLCLSYENNSGKLDRLIALSADEWQAVATLARQLEVGPLLHYRLKQLCITPPNDTAQDLKRVFLLNTARNMRLYQELGNLLRGLNEHNISVILLKGIYLAELVYENIGLRTMGDIDLLVPAEKLEQAISLAEISGFIPVRPLFPEADGLLHFHAPPMVKNGIILELHWNLTLESNPARIETDEIWARAHRTTFQHRDVWTLNPNDLLLHLTIHAAYGHLFVNQFRSLVDLVEVQRKFSNDLDWDVIIQNCKDWHAERGTYLTFRLIGDLFGAGVPSQVLEALQPSDWNKNALDWAKVRLFQSNPELSINYIRLMHNTKISERLSALLTGLFPSREVIAMVTGVRPDSWRIPTLYPRYAISRIINYWGDAWNLIRGDLTQAIESQSNQSLRNWLGIN